MGICIIRCRAWMMIGQRRPRDLSSGQGNLKPLYFLVQIGLNRAFWGGRFRYRQPTRELSVEIPKAPASRVHTRQPARLFRGAIMARTEGATGWHVARALRNSIPRVGRHGRGLSHPVYSATELLCAFALGQSVGIFRHLPALGWGAVVAIACTCAWLVIGGKQLLDAAAAPVGV